MGASRLFRVGQGLLVFLALLVLIVVSPFLMQWYIARFQLDWATLGNAGQAYGVMSAMLSALAFGAVAWSVHVQKQEAKAQRLETLRATHVRVTELALNDPYLLACHPVTREELGRYKRYHYLNLLVWWWHYNFCAGLATEESLRLEVGELFRGEAGREYLPRSRKFRARPKTRESRRFFQIIDEEYAKAVEAGPGVPFALEALSRSAIRTARARSTSGVRVHASRRQPRSR